MIHSKGIAAMALISKLFGIWAVGKTVSATTPLFLRLIMGMAAITVISVVVAILIVMSITGVLWLAYHAMIDGGTTPQLAAAVTGGTVLLIMAIMVAVARHYWMRVQNISSTILHLHTPLSQRMSGLADSFMDGFMSPGRKAG